MLEGSFRKTFVDAEMDGLKIQRRYDSRSNFSGVFGFGWCSTFDIALNFGKALQLKECGKLKAAENIRYINGSYLQRLPSGLVRTFSSETGELKSLKSPTGREIWVERSRLPRDAALGEGLKMRPDRPSLSLVFDPLGETVVALALPSHPDLLRFTYSTDRNLLSAVNAWSNTYSFDYDRLHNLTAIQYPDSTSEHLEYDTDKDQLTKLQGRDHCIETYDHVISKAKDDIHQISEANLMCSGTTKRSVRFDFWFIRKSGVWSLKNMKRGVL